jgi:3'-phosphoadenosine 5'-phosphosulfate sulfotransferase (PAPS reductase)/FAD synthetase
MREALMGKSQRAKGAATRRLAISFSGGETSALMAHLLLTRWRDRFDEHVVTFANTGEENEATLEFIRDCDRHFGFNTVWLETSAPGEHRVVDFGSASRKGEPYEAVIKRYGIPNAGFPHCTRELKMRPMTHYLRSIGWGPGEYQSAVGIRADEATRRAKGRPGVHIVYPLLDWLPTTKQEVNTFWAAQPFRLNLAGYQGNCKWCWKKSTRKLLTVMDDDPSAFDFPERMEREYGRVGPEFAKREVPGDRRLFFRKHTTVADLRALHAAGEWDRAENDAVVFGRRRIALDDTDGCVESCEVDWAHDDEECGRR